MYLPKLFLGSSGTQLCKMGDRVVTEAAMEELRQAPALVREQAM